MTDIEPSNPSVGTIPVSALLSDDVVRIEPGASLFALARLLTSEDVGAAVVGSERVLGIVSERDVVRALAGDRSPATTTVAEVATTELVWADATATVAEVAEEMCERYVRHVLVEIGGELVGIVSARDLLGVYATGDVSLE